MRKTSGQRLRYEAFMLSLLVGNEMLGLQGREGALQRRPSVDALIFSMTFLHQRCCARRTLAGLGATQDETERVANIAFTRTILVFP